jgi:hypothetical protein
MLLNCVINFFIHACSNFFFGKTFFLLFFPLILAFLCKRFGWFILYIWTARQCRPDSPASGPDARSSVGHLCGTLRLDGFSDPSKWGTL